MSAMRKYAESRLIRGSHIDLSWDAADVVGTFIKAMLADIRKEAKANGHTVDWATMGAATRWDGVTQSYLLSVRVDAT